MTLKEFDSKPLTSNEDALAALKESTFEEVCSYIADGGDSNVMRLLNAVWMSRATYSGDQILQFVVRALFPGKGYMRCAVSVTAIELARAAGCETELQRIVQERWTGIDERGCIELVLGLSACTHPAAWLPLIPLLFESTGRTDVKTALIKTVNNIFRAKELPEARRLLHELVNRMPADITAYASPHNFAFVCRLRDSR